jgi:hypothetical protein
MWRGQSSACAGPVRQGGGSHAVRQLTQKGTRDAWQVSRKGTRDAWRLSLVDCNQAQQQHSTTQQHKGRALRYGLRVLWPGYAIEARHVTRYQERYAGAPVPNSRANMPQTSTQQHMLHAMPLGHTNPPVECCQHTIVVLTRQPKHITLQLVLAKTPHNREMF